MLGLRLRSIAPSARRRASRPTGRPASTARVRPSCASSARGTSAVAQHGQRQHNQRQRQRPPEASAEIASSGFSSSSRRGHHRLQRHAADRALPGGPGRSPDASGRCSACLTGAGGLDGAGVPVRGKGARHGRSHESRRAQRSTCAYRGGIRFVQEDASWLRAFRIGQSSARPSPGQAAISLRRPLPICS